MFIHSEIVFAIGVFLQEAGWKALVFGHFSQPLLWITYFSFYTSPCFFIFRPRVGSTFQDWYLSHQPIPGVVEGGWKKLESIALSGAEYWMAVRATFPGRYTFQRTLFYWRRYFRFFPQVVSMSFLSLLPVRPRTCRGLDRPWLYPKAILYLYYRAWAITLLGLGLWTPTNKWTWPINYWAPQ